MTLLPGFLGSTCRWPSVSARMSDEAIHFPEQKVGDSMGIRFFALLAFVLCCCSCNAEEAVVSEPNDNASPPTGETITIPLTEIWSTNQKRMWALDEPVTKYFGEVLKNDPANQALLTDIVIALGSGIKDKANPAFAVEGEEREALRNAHAVLAGKQQRPTSLSSDKSVSIAFFSRSSSYYISITDVKIQGDTIFIKYEYIPHITDDVTSLFALIPLGKLSPGHYRVEIDHEPFEKRFSKFRKSGPHERALGRVSTSFEFDIE